MIKHIKIIVSDHFVGKWSERIKVPLYKKTLRHKIRMSLRKCRIRRRPNLGMMVEIEWHKVTIFVIGDYTRNDTHFVAKTILSKPIAEERGWLIRPVPIRERIINPRNI